MKIKKYVCPICEEEFDTKSEAELCLTKCEADIELIYICPVCRSEYTSESEAEDCLDECKGRLSVEEDEMDITACSRSRLDSVIGRCTTCEYSDGEGFRFADCPYKATGIQLEGCPAYAPAHDLPSICARYNQLKEYGRLTE